jgi:four helix bundle protein
MGYEGGESPKMGLRSFKDLTVWQRSNDLAVSVYKVTENLPGSEIYGLSSQMRRAAVSIPSNIAEGYKRNGRAEYLHFFSIADASAAELETQGIILKEVCPQFDYTHLEQLLPEVQKMMDGLIASLKRRATPNPKPSTLRK